MKEKDLNNGGEVPDFQEKKCDKPVDTDWVDIELKVRPSDTDKGSKCGQDEKERPPEQSAMLVVDGMIYDDSDWEEIEAELKPSSGGGDSPDSSDSAGKGEAATKSETPIGLAVVTVQRVATRCWRAINDVTRGYLMVAIVLLTYVAYFIVAMIHEHLEGEASYRLLFGTILAIVVKTRHRISWAITTATGYLPSKESPKILLLRRVIRWCIYANLLAFMVWILVVQGKLDIRNLRPVPGLLVIMLVCLFFSSAPSHINWHTVYWSLGLQLICTIYVLRFEGGQRSIMWIQSRFDEYFANTEGASIQLFGETYKDHYLIFGAFPIILFSNATLSLLFHLGAIQVVIASIGSVLQFVLDTSPIESTGVAGGIFLEGVMALLTLRPYLGRLTKSQLFLITTSAFSSLGGSYIGMLSAMGVKVFDIIPAMLISAPATFTVCKLLMPETKTVKKIDMNSSGEEAEGKRKESGGFLQVLQTGATQVLPLLGNIVATIFVFNSFIGWTDSTLTWFGERVGIDDLTLRVIMSYLFYPVAFCMGIETNDCTRAASLLGYRIASSNLIAFQELNKMNENRVKYDAYMLATNYTGAVSHIRDDIIIGNQTLVMGFVSDRTERMVTYSLCGFSSLLSVALNLGIMTTLAPRRKAWLSKIFLPALLAGNLANCMTGAFAGIFYYN